MTAKGLDKQAQLRLVLIRWKGMVEKVPGAIMDRNRQGWTYYWTGKKAVWVSSSMEVKQLARQIKPVHYSVPNSQQTQGRALEHDKHAATLPQSIPLLSATCHTGTFQVRVLHLSLTALKRFFFPGFAQSLPKST